MQVIKKCTLPTNVGVVSRDNLVRVTQGRIQSTEFGFRERECSVKMKGGKVSS